MTVSICIHGHFYQPPREDPWLGKILNEASAAPMRHWNERILRESYAPMAWARRLDAEGRIADILNCYEWMSFNAGPTLLHWMRRAAPEVLARMREGDANSKARWGYGNALAQVYHHVIMPLATPEDRALETRWAIDDFHYHFGRAPEGMWLSECAVDIPSLESLAAQGIQFVILAPRQAKAVVENGVASPVDEGSIRVGEPYRVALPSGANMTAVFYHGKLSQSIAFEGLLRDGELFWQRIAGEAGHLAAQGADNPLLTIATDGETYGHHFTFGEMALAHVLSQGYAKRDNLRLTNIAAYIAANPPIREVLLHEPSSWSCVHGVERWRSDCGCSDGGHGGWNQRWRGPLRDALNGMRSGIEAHFMAAGKSCFTDARGALMAYGEVLADPNKGDAYAAKWFAKDQCLHDKAWKLLAMQEQALAAFASCAWFFDDINRIEPENSMTFALRAMELAEATGGPDLRGGVMAELEKAASNRTEAGTGKDVFVREVMPRQDDPATLCLLSFLLLESLGRWPEPGKSALYQWPRISVEVFPEEKDAAEKSVDAEEGTRHGRAVIRTSLEQHGSHFQWSMVAPGKHHETGKPFVTLADCSIRIRPEEMDGRPAGQAVTRKVRDFSRPMRDFLLALLLENDERLRRPELRATAANALSMIDPWLEAQHDVPRPDFWVGFIPYLVLECMHSDNLTTKQRMQVEVLLSLHLSARAKTLAKHLVEEDFLAALAESTVDDAKLAVWTQRVRHIMPDMDWWAVQNTVWERGPRNFPALTKELGFR